MQVERESTSVRVQRRTGEQRVGIYLVVGDNMVKTMLIPHTPYGGKRGIFGPRAIG